MTRLRDTIDGSETNALRQTARMLQTVLETVPACVFWKDTNLAYVGCSKQFAADAGLESPADIVGRTDADLPWMRDGADTWQAEDRFVIETGRPQLASETRLQAADGRTLLVVVSRVPLKDSEGKTIGILGAYEDVTERKLAEDRLGRSEILFHRLFDEAADSLYLGDMSGRFVEANRKACAALGYSREELLSLMAQDVVLDYSRETMLEHWRQLRSGNDVTLRCTHRRKDGSTFPVETHLSLFRYCDQTHVLAVARDITERLRDEEERRAREQQLEEQKRRFYKETIFSVTGGKLDICDQMDVDAWLVDWKTIAEVRTPADVSSARHQAEEYCRAHGMNEGFLKSFILGVGEAVTNALKHACGGRIYAGIADDRVWIGIEDSGPGIDSLILPRAVLLSGFSTKPSLGMGYSVILDVADQVHLKSDLNGTTVILEKSLQSARVEPALEDFPDVW